MKLLKRNVVGYTTYGVIDTPMWPKRYYAGVVVQDREGGWHPQDNTFGWYGKLPEAIGAFEKLGGSDVRSTK